MVKFGDSGRSKTSCVNLKCSSMPVQMAENDEDIDIILSEPEPIKIISLDHENKPVKKVKKVTDMFEWDSSIIKVLFFLYFWKYFPNLSFICILGGGWLKTLLIRWWSCTLLVPLLKSGKFHSKFSENSKLNLVSLGRDRPIWVLTSKFKCGK